MTESQAEAELAVRADRLRERIYIAFATLAVLIALSGHDPQALDAVRTLLITVLGTVLAVFVADVLSHLVVHRRFPTAREFGDAARGSFGAAGAVVAPVLLLAGAALGLFTTRFALIGGLVCVLLGLVLVAYLAIRRIPMLWWQRLIALVVEALLGILVILVQVAAHGG